MTGRRIAFDPDWINGLLGTDISAETMIGYFKKIDLGFDEETQEVIVPSWRQDLLRGCRYRRGSSTFLRI